MGTLILNIKLMVMADMNGVCEILLILDGDQSGRANGCSVNNRPGVTGIKVCTRTVFDKHRRGLTCV